MKQKIENYLCARFCFMRLHGSGLIISNVEPRLYGCCSFYQTMGPMRAQDGFYDPKMAPASPKMAPRWPQTAPDGPKMVPR